MNHGTVTSNASEKGPAKRQRRLRARRRAAHLVEVSLWVPAAAAGDVAALAERLRADLDLEVGPVRRISTGRLERL